MPFAYLALKFVHIVLAIVAIGANITYGVWIARAKKHPAFAATALRGVKFIDDRMANPAYLLMLPTGALMVWLAGYSFATRWIAWAMALWLVAVLLGYLGYTPALASEIRAIDSDGPDSPAAAAASRRGGIFAAILAVVVVGIVVLMVFKPA
ncbi:MAG TPA: DUF2269 family protein [Candidatus Baltobacteraceae bacterium]|nr:DUF2269 family protein [Candidatus Baltobacteraceae bacterium]